MTNAPPTLILSPLGPFNFVDKWSQSTWKRPGAYLWSIEHEDAFLVSYVGQVFGAARNFDKRIWEEYKWWKSGSDFPVDIEGYRGGQRRELPVRPPGHTERELAALMPIIRLWLIPLETAEECTQAQRWLVYTLCRDPRARQFLANRNLDSYRPLSSRPVRFQSPTNVRFHGLTAAARRR